MVLPSVGDRAVHFRVDELLASNRAVLNSSKLGKRSRRMVRRQTLFIHNSWEPVRRIEAWQGEGVFKKYHTRLHSTF